MAKKARQRISYVLDLPNSQPGGHRLGVNGLAIDKHNAILYSGGRDGVVCAWDVTDMKASSDLANSEKPKPATKFRAQTHAHTHWINDIVLAQNNSALVSASSDLTVKVWRPHSETQQDAVTIGEHADYVKCVATPPADASVNWVASGGLDRKIFLWDLNGGGKTLEIDARGEEIPEKGSVYALSAGSRILASGGPESSVRLWDVRTGNGVTKFVGHTDNVRSILLSESGDTIMTASSDQTVKLWSVTAGRCMYTFTMHSDSVWSLYSDDPELGVFYSSDRSGMVAKTDVRGTLADMDDGLALAVAQEHGSVSKLLAADGYIWTATSTSSINRWPDVDMGADIQLPELFRHHRASSTATSRPRESSLPSPSQPPNPNVDGSETRKEIPAKSILRISNTASFPAQRPRDPEAATTGAASTARKGSEIVIEPPVYAPESIYHLPSETIEGQFGLVKHKLLNDRRRVLTLDTAGDVLLWDLIKCEAIQSFGKRHLEDVEPEVNTLEAVAPWCSIDTSSGSLTVVLEPFNCFDAEMYADDVSNHDPAEFRDDQRINLGKWILRYLFANVIDEEIKRDEAHRQKLNEGVEAKIAANRANPPTSIELPSAALSNWEGTSDSANTPRANGTLPSTTPGLAIGMATPAPPRLQDVPEGAPTPSSPMNRGSMQAGRPSGEDYFSSALGIEGSSKPTAAAPATPSEQGTEVKSPSTETAPQGKDKDKDTAVKDGNNGKSPSTPFGKKFRMGMGMGSMSFGSKKNTRSASMNTEKPAVVDEKAEESEESSSNHEKEVDDSFMGVIQRIRNDYDKLLAEAPDKPVETKITPSLPNDTPVLKLPPKTKVILQEETTGSSANLYQGTVDKLGNDTDIIEQRGPMWLGEVLLQNQTPQKDPVKVSFVLQPYNDELPDLAAADGNSRLNANRMLRVKKILSYVAERIEQQPDEPEPDALKPEEYLELYCNNELLPITMTLATLRAHVWKGGNDVMLYYKANGRKEIPIKPPQPPSLTGPMPVDPDAPPAATALPEGNEAAAVPASAQAKDDAAPAVATTS